jgi:hypothetical protein
MGEPELGVYLQHLVGALEHGWTFSISYMGYIILPIDELIFFRGVETTK